jgi:hypothetical protein
MKEIKYIVFSGIFGLISLFFFILAFITFGGNLSVLRTIPPDQILPIIFFLILAIVFILISKNYIKALEELRANSSYL